MDIDALFASTAQLVKLNEDHIPIASASGIILSHECRNYLFTVGHAFSEGLALQFDYDPSCGTACLPLGGGACLLSANQCALNENVNLSAIVWDLDDRTIVDGALFDLPTDCKPIRHLKQQGGNDVKVPLKKFPVPHIECPVDGECSFCGMIKPQYADDNEAYDDSNRFYFYQTPAAYTHIDHTYDEGFFRYFRIRDIDGLEDITNFEGCSGAPLLDEQGNLVAMICGINLEEHTIKALDVGKAFPVLLEVLHQ